MRGLVLLVTGLWASAALGEQAPMTPIAPTSAEPALRLGQGNFSLPVIDYRAPAGTLKRGHGIIVGHDINPNTSVGIGFFKLKPKQSEVPALPVTGKSKKMAVGLSLRF